jgi:RNA polymerase sigma factor (sigma-70 family)
LTPRVKPRAPRERLEDREVAMLVESAASGDGRGWDALVEEFGGMVRAIARGYRLDDADAGDVVQATWLKLVERLEGIHNPGRVGAWLATTARRECLRVVRNAHREVLLGDEVPDHESPEEAALEALVAAERDVALWRSFSRLRPRDQELLRLLVADPRPAYEEISAALDLPIGSIGPTRARALDRLRQDLEAEHTLELVSAG